ncbi:MAG: ergothioneine biosynthesis protein EgtB [Planctomycetes bacterium]|nr:ergothioneine biosynthesis protein EgtB [Planctomycetota bacterium]
MPDRAEIIARYSAVRASTEKLCAPLQTEDYVVQPMTDVSPPRWHIAHVTWFFEQFVLGKFVPNYEPFHPQYGFLFNSYYNLVGERTERPKRGFLTRPTVKEIYAFRHEIDVRMRALLETCDGATLAELLPILEVGLNHEQQHQELLVTDIKYILFQTPLYPAYLPSEEFSASKATQSGEWSSYEGGVAEFGHQGNGFAFDNELPRHEQLLRPFQLADDLVSNGQYLEFIEDGGYTRPEFWLSDGWDLANLQGWQAPLYWLQQNDVWRTHTLYGLRDLNLSEPVTHVSYYEADAFARWAGKRLPTEFEWECAVAKRTSKSAECPDTLHPQFSGGDGLHSIGQTWEWTQSSYLPYPGYRPPAGAIGEYNGKFMVNQMVLRGGSVATPAGHSRPTYRNFWHCDKRWQFTGIRLAEDA